MSGTFVVTVSRIREGGYRVESRTPMTIPDADAARSVAASHGAGAARIAPRPSRRRKSPMNVVFTGPGVAVHFRPVG